MLKFKPEMLGLYFIGGTQNIGGDRAAFLNQLELACQNGITMFQYREKDSSQLTPEQRYQLGQRFREITTRYQIPLIVDDDLELAQNIHADGIHVGQSDERVQEIVQKAPELMLGLSVHDLRELKNSGDLSNVDYLGVGPIYGTHSKADPKQPIGIAGLEKVMNATTKPVVAIGGIHEDNVDDVLKTDADGISIISAIMESNDVARTIKILKGSKMLKIKDIRKQSPVILNIANSVTPQHVADVINFYGASPIMFTDEREARDLTSISSALVINMGSTNDSTMQDAFTSGKAANELNVPIVIDPVAVGTTELRRTNFKKVTDAFNVSVIRGNASEIGYLANQNWQGNGIDAVSGDNDVTNAIEAAKLYQCFVVMSGVKDIVTDGKTTYQISNGHPYFQTNVGSGDMLDGIIGAAIAVDRSLESVARATATLSIVGEIAGEKYPDRPASFFTEVFNQLATIDDDVIDQRIKITKL